MHLNLHTFYAIATVGVLLLPAHAGAEQQSLKTQIVGTWTAVSWVQENKDGSSVRRFGAHPKGVSVFNADGRFFLMFAHPDLSKIASGDPMRTTPLESKTIIEGAVASFGTYSIDEARKSIILRVEASTLPNEIGSQQRRIILSLSADDLALSNTTTFTGDVINYIMKRASAVATP